MKTRIIFFVLFTLAQHCMYQLNISVDIVIIPDH